MTRSSGFMNVAAGAEMNSGLCTATYGKLDCVRLLRERSRGSEQHDRREQREGRKHRFHGERIAHRG